MTAFKNEQKCLLASLCNVEELLSGLDSDDFGRYTEMGLHIDNNDPILLTRNGNQIMWFVIIELIS